MLKWTIGSVSSTKDPTSPKKRRNISIPDFKRIFRTSRQNRTDPTEILSTPAQISGVPYENLIREATVRKMPNLRERSTNYQNTSLEYMHLENLPVALQSKAVHRKPLQDVTNQISRQTVRKKEILSASFSKLPLDGAGVPQQPQHVAPEPLRPLGNTGNISSGNVETVKNSDFFRDFQLTIAGDFENVPCSRKGVCEINLEALEQSLKQIEISMEQNLMGKRKFQANNMRNSFIINSPNCSNYDSGVAEMTSSSNSMISPLQRSTSNTIHHVKTSENRERPWTNIEKASYFAGKESIPFTSEMSSPFPGATSNTAYAVGKIPEDPYYDKSAFSPAKRLKESNGGRKDDLGEIRRSGKDLQKSARIVERNLRLGLLQLEDESDTDDSTWSTEVMLSDAISGADESASQNYYATPQQNKMLWDPTANRSSSRSTFDAIQGPLHITAATCQCREGPRGPKDLRLSLHGPPDKEISLSGYSSDGCETWNSHTAPFYSRTPLIDAADLAPSVGRSWKQSGHILSTPKKKKQAKLMKTLDESLKSSILERSFGSNCSAKFSKKPSRKLRTKDVVYGKGQLQLSIYLNSGLLTVHVISARSIGSNGGQPCNSYVKVSLIPDQREKTCCRTRLIKNDNDPWFDQKFSYEFLASDLNKRLFISLWHRDTTKNRSEFLGCMSFSVSHVIRKDAVGWYRLLNASVGRQRHFAVKKSSKLSRNIMEEDMVVVDDSLVCGEVPAECVNKEAMAMSQEVAAEPEMEDINIKEPAMNTISLRLQKESNGFGFSVTWGRPPRVERIARSSPADNAGMRVGDLITSVGDRRIAELDEEDVLQLIKSSGDTLLLQVQRKSDTPVPRTTYSLGGLESSSVEKGHLTKHALVNLEMMLVLAIHRYLLVWRPCLDDQLVYRLQQLESLCENRAENLFTRTVNEVFTDSLQDCEEIYGYIANLTDIPESLKNILIQHLKDLVTVLPQTVAEVGLVRQIMASHEKWLQKLSRNGKDVLSTQLYVKLKPVFHGILWKQVEQQRELLQHVLVFNEFLLFSQVIDGIYVSTGDPLLLRNVQKIAICGKNQGDGSFMLFLKAGSSGRVPLKEASVMVYRATSNRTRSAWMNLLQRLVARVQESESIDRPSWLMRRCFSISGLGAGGPRSFADKQFYHFYEDHIDDAMNPRALDTKIDEEQIDYEDEIIGDKSYHGSMHQIPATGISSRRIPSSGSSSSSSTPAQPHLGQGPRVAASGAADDASASVRNLPSTSRQGRSRFSPLLQLICGKIQPSREMISPKSSDGSRAKTSRFNIFHSSSSSTDLAGNKKSRFMRPLESITVGRSTLHSTGESSESSPSWNSAPSSSMETPNDLDMNLAFDFTKKCDLSTCPDPNKSRLILPKTKVSFSTPSTPENSEASASSPRSSGTAGIFRFPFTGSSSTRRHRARTLSGDRQSSQEANGGKKNGQTDTDARQTDTDAGQTVKRRLPRFLRRTHSASCTRADVPAYALFLRYKHPVSKAQSTDLASVNGDPDISFNDDIDTAGCHRSRLSEMKLRLGFLNRRSTETALSVRPQPQEAQKWAQSFADLMASKYGASLYRAFLQREFSDENFDFWMACEDFKKSRSQKLSAKAQKIYNEFIAVQAPREVNLDPETRLETLAGLQTPVPDRNAFERAQRRVQGLLERDSYVRFLQSDLFLELIHPERYQECNDASR